MTGVSCACLEPTGECAQVLALPDGGERLQRLAGDQRSHASLDEPAQRADPASTSAAVGDEGAGGCERPSDLRQGLRFHVVEDDVVALSRLREVRSRVVDDVVSAHRPDQLHVAGAAHPGHLCPERLGDLDGERPYAARCAGDQHRLPGLHVRDVAQSLQCGDRRGGHRGRLRHGQPAGFAHQLVRRHGRILRQRPGSAPAEHLIARFEVRDRSADGFYHTGDVPARDRGPGPAKSERQPHDARHAGHHEVVAGVDRSGADADEDVAVPHDRPAHIACTRAPREARSGVASQPSSPPRPARRG